MAPRADIPGAHEPASSPFRGVSGTIIFWDMSGRDDRSKPDRNDRIDKLGRFAASHGGVVGLVGSESGRAFIVDGTQEVGHPDPLSTILPFEPDNWTPRYHEYVPGKQAGRDSVWALRLISDHAKKDVSVANRSTMVIDNGDDSEEQAWGVLSDIVQVTGRRVRVDSPGLAYTAAGFLAMLGGYAVDSESRDPNERTEMPFVLGRDFRCNLAINFSTTGGYVTDGTRVAQLFHALTFMGNAGSFTGFQRPDAEEELGLRSDCGIKFGNKVGRMVLDDAKANEDQDGDIKRVHLFMLMEEAPAAETGLDVGMNRNSKNGPINKTAKKKALGGWVKVKKYGDSDHHTYDYSYHCPPPDGSSGSSGRSGSSVATPGGSSGGNGSGTPPSTGSNPDGGPPDVPTYDPGWEPPVVPMADATAEGSIPTEQVQHGYAPAASPGFTQRTNIFINKADVNPVGTMVKTKPRGYSKVRIRTKFRVSDAIGSGECIELNVKVIPQEGSAAPINIYLQTFNLFENVDPGVWYQGDLIFTGFSVNEEQVLNIIFERRNDTTLGTNAAAELWVERSSAIMER